MCVSLRNFFSRYGYGMPDFQIFLPEHNDAACYLFTCVVSDRKAVVVFVFAPLYVMGFPLPSTATLSSRFSFYLFQQFEYGMSVYIFLNTALGSLRLLNFSFDVFHYFWKIYGFYLFKYFFCLMSSLLSFWDSKYKYLDDLTFPHISLMLCPVCFHSFYFFPLVFTFG